MTPYNNIYFSLLSLSHSVMFDPVDCSTPGLAVLHRLPEPAQTLVHRIGDAIQPSHPLSSPSPPALNLSQLFASGGQSIGASASASVLQVNIQGWSPLGWTGLKPLTACLLRCMCISSWFCFPWGAPKTVWSTVFPRGEGYFCLSLLSPAHKGPFGSWAFSKLLSAVAGLRLMPGPRATWSDPSL